MTEEGSPESVHTGPVSDGNALYVVGQTGSVSGIYRYELTSQRWSHVDMPNGVCNLGAEASLRDGVLLSAGETTVPSGACAYDLVHASHAGEVAGLSGVPTVVSFGADHVLFWGRNRGTDEGHGEMPREPTRWLENTTRLLRFEVIR